MLGLFLVVYCNSHSSHTEEESFRVCFEDANRQGKLAQVQGMHPSLSAASGIMSQVMLVLTELIK